MKASIVDLRYNMKDILKALERKEDVEITYRGKKRGVIIATQPRKYKNVEKHPYFGMCKDGLSVEDTMDTLRGGRFNDI